MAASNKETDEKLDPVGAIVSALKNAAAKLMGIQKQEDQELAEEMAEVESIPGASSASTGQVYPPQDDTPDDDDDDSKD